MSAFTLDDIVKSAEAKYGTVEITLGSGEVCKLRNALRLPKKERDALSNIQDRLGEDEVDHGVVLAEALILVAENKVVAQEMVEEIGEDLAVMVSVFDAYTSGTQAGEA